MSNATRTDINALRNTLPKQFTAGEVMRHLPELTFRQVGNDSIIRVKQKTVRMMGRRRFAFALPGHKIGVEVADGTSSIGRHSRGAGFERDCENYNHAALHGWRVLTVPTGMVKRDDAFKAIREIVQ